VKHDGRIPFGNIRDEEDPLFRDLSTNIPTGDCTNQDYQLTFPCYNQNLTKKLISEFLLEIMANEQKIIKIKLDFFKLMKKCDVNFIQLF